MRGRAPQPAILCDTRPVGSCLSPRTKQTIGARFSALALFGTLGCSEEAVVSIPVPVDAGDSAIRASLAPTELLRRVVTEAPESTSWLAPAVPADTELWTLTSPEGSVRALSKRGASGTAVVVLPHLDGGEWVYRYVLNRLATDGYSVLAALPPDRAIREEADPGAFTWTLRQRIRTGRMLVGLARSELAPTCLGLVGLSIGAMAAVPVAALEPGIGPLALVLGGGGLSYIAQETAEPRLRRAFATSDPRVRADDYGALEPLAWAPLLDGNSALLVRARWDRVVPKPASRALERVLSPARTITYPAGHYSFAVFLPAALSLISEHIESACAGAGP